MAIYRETLGRSLHRIHRSQVLHLVTNSKVAHQPARIWAPSMICLQVCLILILISYTFASCLVPLEPGGAYRHDLTLCSVGSGTIPNGVAFNCHILEILFSISYRTAMIGHPLHVSPHHPSTYSRSFSPYTDSLPTF